MSVSNVLLAFAVLAVFAFLAGWLFKPYREIGWYLFWGTLVTTAVFATYLLVVEKLQPWVLGVALGAIFGLFVYGLWRKKYKGQRGKTSPTAAVQKSNGVATSSTYDDLFV